MAEDLSKLSNKELMKIAGLDVGGESEDLSSMSTEELFKIADVPKSRLGRFVSNIEGPIVRSLDPFHGLGGVDTTEELMSERVSPLLSFGSGLAFGLPKEGLKKFAPEVAEKAFPEQKTGFGKILRFGAETGGFLRGGALKTGKFLSKLLLPVKPLAGAKKRGVVREALKFGTAGFLQTPETEDQDLLAPKQRVGSGLLSAGLIPAGFAGGRVIGAGLKKASEFTSKVRESLNRNGTVIRTADFVRSTLAPRVNDLFRISFQKFDEGFKNFARKKLRMPDNVVNHISKKTPQKINQSAIQLGEDTQRIVTSMDDAFTNKEKEISRLYESAFSNIPRTERVIPIDNTFRKMRNVLEEAGFARGDKLTARADDPLQSSTLRSIASEFKFLRPESTRFGQITSSRDVLNKLSKQDILDNFSFAEKEVLANRMKTTINDLVFNTDKQTIIRGLNSGEFQKVTGSKIGKINSVEWKNLRDGLTNLYKRDPGQRITIKKILDVMHDEAEKSGIKGITTARNEFSKSLEFFSLQSKVKENTLNRIFSLDKRTTDNITKLEKYLGNRNT